MDSKDIFKILSDVDLEKEELKKEELKALKQKELIAFSSLMDNEIGIKFLKQLMINSGYNQSSLLLSQSNSMTDIHKMAFMDGMKQMFRETMDLLNNELLIKVFKDDR